MADTFSIWSGAQGIYQDFGRDRVPGGSVWDLVDYVPDIIGAPIRQRGKWVNQSDALPAAPSSMLYAVYKAGPKLLALNGSDLRDIPTGSVGSTSLGTAVFSLQNPVFHRDLVIIPAADGSTLAKYVAWNGTSFTLTNGPGAAIGKYATVFKDRTLIGGPAANVQQVAFSKPGNPTAAFDALSIINSSLPLTGLAAQRNQILCFHAGSVERIRGTTPPDSTLSDPTGDMALDSLFDRAGCFDARSIAYWNDNVIFADARGVHITDGAIVRNMAAQGGITSLWRRYFHDDASRGAVVSLAGGVFRDLYIVCIHSTSGPAVTFVCDIATRRWYRFGNVDSQSFAFSVGVGESLYGTDSATKKVIDLSAAFSPDASVLQVDGNGVNVLPVLETGFMKLTYRRRSGKTIGAGLKRLFYLFFEYSTIEAASSGNPVLEVSYLHSPEDTTYEVLPVGLKYAAEMVRRKLPFRRRLLGFSIRVAQLLPTRDTRLYEIAVQMNPEEESRVS